ncbi:MAG TPA: response regulator transcription factor [Niallia sp.]|nr:response regulator transcription factor [Niallia sp.]
MKKVLIVDDEPTIREGLPYIIDWQDYGYEIVGAAQNGKEGISFIQKYQPDVVITDIRMPEMDGLEMIQHAKQIGHSFYSIILSGYSEFTYAQKAIRLGTVSYLLKPIDEDELTDILQGIEEKESEYQVDMTSLLKKKIFEGDQTSIAQDYALANLIRFTSKSVANKFQHSIKEKTTIDCYLLTHDDYIYALMLVKDSFLVDIVDKEIFLLAKNENETILQSSWFNKNHYLNQLYTQIKELKDTTFLYSNLGVISNERIQQKQSELTYTNENIKEELLNDLKKGGNLPITLLKYRDHFSTKQMKENEIKWAVIHDFYFIINKVIENMDQLDKDSFLEIGHSLQEEVVASNTMEQVLDEMTKRYSLLQQKISEDLNRVNTIQEIIFYTKKHYREDLNLKIISEHFNYNNAYIGKKFKQETGKSYSRYLDEIRMGKAKQLLKESNLMIYEIAERTGYANLDYFYKKFKRYCGMSPNEYRKLNSTGENNEQ